MWARRGERPVDVVDDDFHDETVIALGQATSAPEAGEDDRVPAARWLSYADHLLAPARRHQVASLGAQSVRIVNIRQKPDRPGHTHNLIA